jgi:hypothetical protein
MKYTRRNWVESATNLLIYDELRHFMTHGFMRMDIDKSDNHQFEFLRYQRDGEGKFTLLGAKTTVKRLRQAVEDNGEYVSHVIQAIRANLSRAEVGTKIPRWEVREKAAVPYMTIVGKVTGGARPISECPLLEKTNPPETSQKWQK